MTDQAEATMTDQPATAKLTPLERALAPEGTKIIHHSSCLVSHALAVAFDLDTLNTIREEEGEQGVLSFKEAIMIDFEQRLTKTMGL